ncbi:hypothetical protein A4R35_00995 [Thermogemmatispora tikiterensis]|uniref:Uncharacterized protein n=1 Tax=Thermogemmatispora tikiterensis TaxID=1825093 RepID=A0A328V968_9CHLR|nr:hypothetical protein A4R35_00995 [Thermogemmatispora tikiterensis]
MGAWWSVAWGVLLGSWIPGVVLDGWEGEAPQMFERIRLLAVILFTLFCIGMVVRESQARRVQPCRQQEKSEDACLRTGCFPREKQEECFF